MWTVEARIFNTGKIVAKIRPATEGEEDSYTEARSCDIYVDVFETENEARQFYNDYKRA